MAREKKLQSPVTLFVTIEARQHEALRTIAFNERRSLADVVRGALAEFIKDHPKARAAARVRVVAEEKVKAPYAR